MAAPQSPPESPPDAGRPVRNACPVYSDIPYQAAFSDDLCRRVMEPDSVSSVSGIPITLPSSKGRPKENAIRLTDINPATLPQVDSSELPLSLDDPRRRYASCVPGVLLTHPGGWFEGSSPAADLPSSSIDRDYEAAKAFIEDHDIMTATQFKGRIQVEIKKQMEQLKLALQERKEVMEENDKIDKEIKQLEVQRQMERRIEEKMRANAKRMKLG